MNDYKQLPKGWEIKKLGEVCVFFDDGNWIEKKDQSEEGIRLIQTGNIGNGVFKRFFTRISKSSL